MTREEKIKGQREAYAIYACYLMHKTAEEAAACLAMTPGHVKLVYGWIERDRIDFDSPFSE